MENLITENSQTIVIGIITGIIAGIISAIIMILSTSIINFIYFSLITRLRLSRFFGLKDKDDIYIAAGDISNISNSSITTIKNPDFTAVNYIVGTLQEIYKKSKIRPVHTGANNQIQSKDDNIVCVGGPKHNGTTKLFLENLPSEIEIKFDESKLIVYTKSYEKGYDEDLKENIDYGLLAKIKNPFAHDKYVFIVAGCGTHGVLASSYLITNQRLDPTLKTDLIKKLGRFNIKKSEFIAVVKCKTSDDEIAKPKIVFAKKIKNGERSKLIENIKQFFLLK